MRVGIFLFDGVDLLDAGGPYEVFLTANRLAERSGETAPFELATVTEDGEAVAAYGGLRLVPHTSVKTAGRFDIVIIPGTMDLQGVLSNAQLMQTIAALTADADLTGSVCTGAFFLGDNGDLAGLPWTTHWEDIDALAERIGPDGARRAVRWVDAGKVITAGGLVCGIDMALHIVRRVSGLALAERTARQIDMPWRANGCAAPRGTA